MEVQDAQQFAEGELTKSDLIEALEKNKLASIE